MLVNPDMVAYFPRIAALAALDSFAGVVYNHHAYCRTKTKNMQDLNGKGRSHRRRQPEAVARHGRSACRLQRQRYRDWALRLNPDEGTRRKFQIIRIFFARPIRFN
jgi:hypothetical protein